MGAFCQNLAAPRGLQMVRWTQVPTACVRTTGWTNTISREKTVPEGTQRVSWGQAGSRC